MTCKIPPKSRGSRRLLSPGSTDIDFASDQELWEYEEWRRSGGHATASIPPDAVTPPSPAVEAGRVQRRVFRPRRGRLPLPGP